MKAYFIDLWDRLKKSSLIKKIVFIFLFLISVFFLLISFIKIDVSITTPGNLHSPTSSVAIEDSYKPGSIASISVFTYNKVSILQYWLSKANDKFDVEEIDENYYLSDKEDTKQGMIMKDNSTVLALINAYREAKKVNPSIIFDEDSYYLGESVIAIYSYSKTSLEYGDIIVQVNGENFKSYDEFINIIQNSSNKKYLKFIVKRGEKELEAYAEAVEIDDKLSYGFSVDSSYKSFETTPKYTINPNYSTIGPSGGAMSALAIYNMLLEEDISEGIRITGTGTIDVNGNIGKIGGIKQKIITAKNYNVDIFFVGVNDYEDALDAYNEFDCNFELVKVATFREMIEYLNNLEARNGN